MFNTTMQQNAFAATALEQQAADLHLPRADPPDGARGAPRPAGRRGEGPRRSAWSTAARRRSWPPTARCKGVPMPGHAGQPGADPAPGGEEAGRARPQGHRGLREGPKKSEGRPHEGARHGPHLAPARPTAGIGMAPPGRTRETGAPVEPSTDLAAPDRALDAPARHPMFRLRFGFVVIAMVLSVFGVRLVQLQGIDPKAYAAMAAREGSVQVVLPAERGAIADRNGVELATSVDGMMIVADPQMTRDDAPAIATYLADELDLDYFQTLDRLRTGGGSRFEYVARRVPSTVANRVLGDLDDPRLQGPERPPRPDAGLPLPRRRREPDRLPRRGPAAGRARAHLRRAALRHRRRGDVRGGRRQPHPARQQHHRQAAQRRGPAADHRPRRAVVRPARPAQHRPRRQWRLRGGRGDGLPHRRAALARGLPLLRRPVAALLAEGRPRLPRAERRLRTGLGREGADRLLADRRRQAQPAHPHPGALPAAPPGCRAAARPLGPRPAALHPGRRHLAGPPTSAPCSRPGSSPPRSCTAT